MLGRNIKRLSVHRPSGFVPSHLTAFVCFAEQSSNAARNMYTKLQGNSSNANRLASKGGVWTFDIAVGKAHRLLPRSAQLKIVYRCRSTIWASPDHLPVHVAYICLSNNLMLDSANSTTDAITNKESHFEPRPKLCTNKGHARRFRWGLQHEA